jgi:hypothetical protein
MASFIRFKPAPWKDSKNKKAGKAMSLWAAVRDKNWEQIAYNYNGPTYKKYQYDTKLRSAYEKYKRQVA